MDAVELAAHVACGLAPFHDEIGEVELFALNHHATAERVARLQACALGALNNKLLVAQVAYHAHSPGLPREHHAVVNVEIHRRAQREAVHRSTGCAVLERVVSHGKVLVVAVAQVACQDVESAEARRNVGIHIAPAALDGGGRHALPHLTESLTEPFKVAWRLHRPLCNLLNALPQQRYHHGICLFVVFHAAKVTKFQPLTKKNRTTATSHFLKNHKGLK